MTKKSEEKRTVGTSYARFDVRYIYVGFLVFMAIPILSPLGLPVLVSPPTRDLYNFVEKNIGKGDNVLCWGEMTLNVWPTEYKPGGLAVSNHLLSKGAKLYFISVGPEDPLIVDLLINMLDKGGGAKYGVDYVNLGYYAGGEIALAAFAKDIQGMVKTDYYGTPVGQISMMKDVKDAKSFKLVMCLSSIPAEWPLRQYNTAYGVPITWISPASMINLYLPYYASGQAVGFVGGIRGGAEYETLVKRPGAGLAGTDAVSFGYLYFAGIMVFTNAVYLVQRKGGKKE